MAVTDELTNVEGVITQDFEIQIGERTLSVRVLLPLPERLAENPLLMLHFASSKESALYEEPYSMTTAAFLEKGHRVLSFDLPNHGARIDEHGEGIVGFCNAFIDGHDTFGQFVNDASAVIDFCVAEGIVESDRIVVCGTSRAAYLSLRLLAGDERIQAAAAIAPVTDWRMLSEFRAIADRPEVAALFLSNYINQNVHKPLYLVIGNHDERVSTTSCCQYYLDLEAARIAGGQAASQVNFQVLNVPGHYSPVEWHIEAAHFLMEKAPKTN